MDAGLICYCHLCCEVFILNGAPACMYCSSDAVEFCDEESQANIPRTYNLSIIFEELFDTEILIDEKRERIYVTGRCSICLTDQYQQEGCIVLKCGHLFHAGCAESWMIVRNTCPNCRAVLE